jgi:predicted glutamine amidotransferase
MCRLFGMTTGGPRVQASFWLLDAPQSLKEQSVKMPHGVGLGWFSLGDEPVRDRAPLAAFENADFALQARNVFSHTFISHVRYASTGAVKVHNCHPFHMHDRLYAHNGVVKGLDILETWLTDVDKAFVEGTTDSELAFAYVNAEIRRRGDTTTGVIEAVRRIGAHLPLYSFNILVAEARKLWALRYPASNELWVLPPKVFIGESQERPPVWHLAGQEPGSVDVTTPEAYVVASEPMDGDPAWRLLEPGELLVIDGLKATSLFPFEPPRHQLHESDLSAVEAASQEDHAA